MNKSEKTFSIIAVFSIVAAIGYAIYVYVTTGSLPFVGAGGILSGGNLSSSDISGYASNAGFSGADLNTAVAIALAESSGNPAAVGDLAITPGGSIGLWQINLKAHPEYTAQQLTDPQSNANAAYAIYQAAGNSFSPWSTFNGGAYAQYLPSTQPDSSATEASAAPAGGTQEQIGGTQAATGSTADALNYGADSEDV
jgi:hypothetical protein